MNLRSACLLAALVLPCWGTVASLQGATVTAGDVTTVAQGGVAPGSSANYDFFGGGAQPSHLTNFTLTTPPPSQFNGQGVANYPTLQPPGGGTVFTTGIGYSSTTVLGATANLATFTTGALTGSAYSVYVLFGNTDLNLVKDASIGLSINNGAFTTISVTDVQNTDNFVRFDVTGAQAGDVLTIDATTPA